MKCGCLLLKQRVRNKDKIKLYLSRSHVAINDWPTSNEDGKNPFFKNVGPFKELEKCDGQIIASVRAVDEPDYYSSSYAELRVEYRCNKCGNTTFEELPTTDSALSDLLTEFVANMPEERRDEILAGLRTKRLEAEAAREKMMADFRKQQEAADKARLAKRQAKVAAHEAKMKARGKK